MSGVGITHKNTEEHAMECTAIGTADVIGLGLAGAAHAQDVQKDGAAPLFSEAGIDAEPGVTTVVELPGDTGACKHVKPRFLRGALFGDRRPRTTNDIMQSYVGNGASQLVSRWGAPTTTFDNRDGSRILTWRDEWSGCTQTVLVDQADIVSRWRYSGCRCLQGKNGPPKGTPIPAMTL